VLLEEVIYSGIQQAIAAYHTETLTVPTDAHSGMDVDAVERLLRQRRAEGLPLPRFIYTVVHGHNPLGVTMSHEKQLQLVRVAREFSVPIIEDDAYGFLIYEGSGGTLHSIAPDLVFYVGTFSKIMMPALRLGWLLAPADLDTQLQTMKETSDLESSQLTQRAVAAYLATPGAFDAHLAEIRAEYARRLQAMLGGLARHFPASCRWTEPRAGMFVWVTFDGVRGVDMMEVLQHAVAEAQVAFIPGSVFAVPTAALQPRMFGEGGHSDEGLVTAFSAESSLRLNFSNVSPAAIDDGLRRLGALLSLRLYGK
jgi:2-aminoadipate transaminase